MRRMFFLAGAVLAASAFAVLACNAVLGIDSATLLADAGSATNYAVSCTNYCSLLSTVCVPSTAAGDNTEYLNNTVCATMCPYFDAGPAVLQPSVDPTPADTLSCRIWHANAAILSGDPHTHCAHAGPLGGGVCDDNGDACLAFCRLDLDICTGDAAAYTGLDDCLSACHPDGGYVGFPYELKPTDVEVSDLTFHAGNTLNCRIYHLENFVATGDPVHCTHTSAGGGGVCDDPAASDP
jgi:hypothetical protein